MRQQDELQSIQRFILASFPGALDTKPQVFLGRPAGDTKRPYFRIENPAGPKSVLTPAWYMDERVWVVSYFGTNRSDSQNRGSLWEQKLFNDPRLKFKIPGWLFDFPYYPANLYVINDVGATLPAGSYSVQIVAENDYGHLTKPSAVSTIAISGTGKAIQVQVPREPRGYPIGYRFHIYLSGSAVTPTAAHRIGSIAYTGNLDPVFTITQDVPNGTVQGNAPPLMSSLPASSEVRFRYMAVKPESFDALVIEEPEVNGLFNYVVRFQTSALGLRESPHNQGIAQVTTNVAPTF